MPQPHSVEESTHAAVETAGSSGNVGDTIVEHVSNSSLDHPLIHLPPVFGIDMSVTKHVLMLWIVAAIVLLVVTVTVRRYIRQERLVPSGFMNALEFIVLYIRDEIVAPAVGKKWVDAWTPLLVTLFLFILTANLIGLVPVFDALALLNHTVLHLPEEAFLSQVTHGGTTATGNFNVTAGLATVTFFAIIIAGSRAHGFVQHWKNMVPHGVNPVVTWLLLIPIETIGMFVRPFALTMRLAANMTGGHIAILAILSFVFIFAQQFGPAAGMGVGIFSLTTAIAISVLEVIVVFVQAYVFTLLTAVFIGMAIHAHH
jgi:F-type H+-transporting ATPase subunit a